MAGVFHKAMVWLGLAPDDEYDDYPYDAGMGGPARGPARAPQMSPRPAPGARGPAPGRPQPPPGPRQPSRPGPGPEYEEEGFVSPRQPQGRPGGVVRQIPPRGGQRQPGGGQDNPTVRAMRPTAVKPAELAPGAFEDAKDVADYFKAGQPVVMDLAGADRELTRRLIDFASGTCYALGGAMEKVRAGGYLLIPPGVEVSDEERRRLSSGGR